MCSVLHAARREEARAVEVGVCGREGASELGTQFAVVLAFLNVQIAESASYQFEVPALKGDVGRSMFKGLVRIETLMNMTTHAR